MTNRRHRLLQRQLKEHSLNGHALRPIRSFISAVNDAYLAAEDEHRRLALAFEIRSKELSQTSTEIRQVLSALPDLLFRINSDGTICDLRGVATSRTAELLRELASGSGDDTEPRAPQFDECLRSVRETQIAEAFVVRNPSSSRDIFYEIRLLPVCDGDVLGIARDITAQKEAEIERELAEERLRLQAYHDPLTGLPNRVLFQQSLDRAIASADRSGGNVAVLFLDLDRFKHVNDLLGHSIGDMLLQEVAARLTHRIQTEHTLARMGGDEFTVLIPQVVSADEPQTIAGRLLEALEPPFELAYHELFISGSIGISVFPTGGRAGQILLQHADIAMYRTKARGGRSFSLYTDGVDSKTTERIKLENSLRRAFNRGEFVLHYQPLVRAQDCAIVGFEALIRWNHPEYGMVAPSKFIQLTEETGLIVKLGEWVLRKACEQAAAWESRGHAMRIAVNLSARQFDTPGLTAMVAKVLADTSLTPALLELELTEGMVLNHEQSTIGILNSLRALGVRLSIDDFGTGYSSLSQLRQLPFDVLKIDRSFLRELAVVPRDLELPLRKQEANSEPTQNSIMRAIVEIAHALSLEIVAEGVETEEQRALVQRLGCDIVQGFLYSKPLPQEEADALLDTCAGSYLMKAA